MRRLDHLGRIVLPIELRRSYGLGQRDSLEIFTQGDQIVLRKYQPLCIFCGSGAGTATFEGKKVCHSCRSRLVEVPAGL